MLRMMHTSALAFLAARVAYAPPDGGGSIGADDLKKLETSINEMGVKMQKGSDELKKAADLFMTETKNLGKVTEETKLQVDKALTEGNKNAAELATLQAKFAKLEAGALGVGQPTQSAGEEFVQSESFKEKAKAISNGERTNIRQAIVTSLTTDAAGSAGAAVAPDRRRGILMPGMQQPRIRSLLMPGTTDSNLIQYVKEKGYTDNAQSQNGEGELKGQSDIQLELISSAVVTIAHFIVASRQILDDAAAVRSLIDFRLRYGLMMEEDNQLLNGTGASSTLSGLIQNSTAYVDQLTVTAEQYVDVLRMAMLQAFLAEWPATGHILHPADWARIELLKDGEDRYLWADPRSLAPPSMWGLPVVQTQAMRETKFMTGAFVPAAQIFDRQGAVVEVSTEDSDNFRRNLVTIRAEERLTLAVYRDEALIYGDFGEAS
jgi:HK97 family phage major capsid protein